MPAASNRPLWRETTFSGGVRAYARLAGFTLEVFTHFPSGVIVADVNRPTDGQRKNFGSRRWEHYANRTTCLENAKRWTELQARRLADGF